MNYHPENIDIKLMQSSDKSAWDGYVHSHPQSTLYHLSGWKDVIEKTYGHKAFYLMAVKHETWEQADNKSDSLSQIAQNSKYKTDDPIIQIVGILPLFHLKHFNFEDKLIT